MEAATTPSRYGTFDKWRAWANRYEDGSDRPAKEILAIRELTKLVRSRGAVTVTDLASHIAGEEIRGSWWGHPMGKEIYRLLRELLDHPDVFCCKLIDGNDTLVHRRLWPALVRAQRERKLWPPISTEAKRLLHQVKRKGRVLASGKARLELERALLVVGQNVHTETGAHKIELMPFESWVPGDEAAAADAMTLDEALTQLRDVGGLRRSRGTQ